MSLRVIVPPHPLVAHWLTVLRDPNTPTPLFASAMKELGRWLSYEAIRDWLPQQKIQLQTAAGLIEAEVIDASAALLVVPIIRAGLGLWLGGQEVLPNARIAHVGILKSFEDEKDYIYLDNLPNRIGDRVGALIYCGTIATGSSLIKVLSALDQKGVKDQRLRVICAVASAPGLRCLADLFPNLSIYTACIDADLDQNQNILPGIGDAAHRLYGTASDDFLG